jgi:nucleoside-diphosphate-sugar epimerase
MMRNHSYGSNIHAIALGRDEKCAQTRFALHLENSQFTFITHDISDPLPELGHVDYIIHAASNTHPAAYASDPVGTMTANMFGTYNLLDYAATHETKRFVFLSTVEIYGEDTGAIERFRETDMGYIDCNTLRAGYPESKRASEALCNAFSVQHGIDSVIARLCRVYGSSMYENDSKSTSQFIRDAASGRNIILKSKGEQLYSCCYCADAVSAILYIMLLGNSGEAYNIADTKSDMTLKEIAELLGNLSGTNVQYELPTVFESQGFSNLTKALLDPAKLYELGWSARDTIESGLAKTLLALKG